MNECASASIKGLIFDFGATLDTPGVHWSHVMHCAFAQAGCNIPYTRFFEAWVHAERTLSVLPTDDMLTLLRKKTAIQCAHLGCGNYEHIAQICLRQSLSYIEQRVRPRLENCPLPKVVVSNFYGNLDCVLQSLGLHHYFLAAIDSARVGVRKPDPAIFRLGCQALALPPEQVLVVGDSLAKDIIPARTLGCHTHLLRPQNQLIT